MKLFNSVGNFFALDIGSTAIRVVELKRSGDAWELVKYGVAPVDMKVATSDAAEDQKRLGDSIASLISQTAITTRDVVLGIPSGKMFATVVDLPDLPPQELASTIKYQAEQFVPMSIDDAKIDWAVIGKSTRDPQKNEVLLASVTNNFSEARLDLVESVGLNVIALEPDPLALVRALVPRNDHETHMIIDFGDFNTDIVIVLDQAPRLIRSIPFGKQTLIKAAAQNLNIDANQANQFILKFGLHADRLEGQITKALDATLDQFIVEINKSIKFFQSRYPSVPLNSTILSGYTLSIPGFGEYIAGKTGIHTTAGNAWGNVRYNPSQQDGLMQVAAQFAVAVGLAERMV
ncbi:MAG TPA: type IV pilus assembly protein PilM [Patescibacteria group bacterium]|jgi:type IV pilus assembly protein PilM|nr:type IV pilus assembly protein PilM [Patescibacteria group bacterium]